MPIFCVGELANGSFWGQSGAARQPTTESDMYIARWLLTAHYGHKDATINLLKKWEGDVGQRIGWRANSIRVTCGAIGIGQSSIEFEVRVDSLNDLESAWGDMAKNPYHAQYLKELEPHIMSGSNIWQVLELVDLSSAD